MRSYFIHFISVSDLVRRHTLAQVFAVAYGEAGFNCFHPIYLLLGFKVSIEIALILLSIMQLGTHLRAKRKREELSAIIRKTKK